MLLTPENSSKVVVQSKTTSEQTYRALLGALRECWPISATIEPNYFPDAKEGDITLATIGQSVRIDIAKFEIRPSGAAASVSMLTRSNNKRFDDALPAWVEGRDGGCPLGTRYQAPYPSHDPWGSGNVRQGPQ
ncbi:hypothetical protein [Variovorax sp. JS1663]|uniref:hypothetical protein n=1 Tax=Variovorax sp. JS1663 TaxID=1851577 RepID=UPI00118019A3|nr:hypothetical protein [Variovorax sp. JS1663]